MKIRKEYIILFLIIAVLVLYIALRKDSRIQYEIPDIAELSPESISGIVIKGNDTEIHLTEENGKWFIGADKYSADSSKMEKMIDFLEKPVLITVVSDSKDYMRYGLDDKNRITVKALSGENPERVVDLGYHTDVRNYTFVKLENDHRVYHARGDLRDVFSTDIDDIRDKTVLNFDSEEIKSVQLSRDGKSLVINKKAVSSGGEEDKNIEYRWETDDGKIAETPLMISLIDDISKIKCAEYLYDQKEDEPVNPLYLIKLKGKNEHILTVYPKKEDDYTAVSSDNPSPFNLYSWRIDNIIEKFDEISKKGDVNEGES